MYLFYAHPFKYAAVESAQEDVARNAAEEQMRRPVPPEMVGGFANVTTACFAFGGVGKGQGALSFGYVRQGGTEEYGKDVFAFFQQIFDVENVSAVRIPRRCDYGAVQ